MFPSSAAVVLALAAVTTTPAEATPGLVPAADREVIFTVDGTTTYGTLHVPAHRAGQRLRAALLLPGSGPTDRDGNQPSTSPNTLALVAGALGRDRVATLRFDKYGTGRTGLGAYRDHPEKLDYPAFVRQAKAAYESLRDQPETDPHALMVVGHSEGAMTALVLGGTVRPHPTGLALLQPQAIRLLDLVRCNCTPRSPRRPGRVCSPRSSSARSTPRSTPPSPPCANTARSTPPACRPPSPNSSGPSKDQAAGSCSATTPSTRRPSPRLCGRGPGCC